MKKTDLKKHLGTVLFGLGLAMAPMAASALTTTVTDECSKELLLSYFPDAFVGQTLKKFNIPQDKWESISAGLAAKDKDVLKIVEEKASKLNPNPFKDRDPAQRQIAVKIFRETLTQVFSEVMKANGINDDKQIASMLDDIQQQKAKNFAQCMEKQKQNFQTQQQQAPAKETAPASSPAQGSTSAPAGEEKPAAVPYLADNAKPVSPSAQPADYGDDDHDEDDDHDSHEDHGKDDK